MSNTYFTPKLHGKPASAEQIVKGDGDVQILHSRVCSARRAGQTPHAAGLIISINERKKHRFCNDDVLLIIMRVVSPFEVTTAEDVQKRKNSRNYFDFVIISHPNLNEIWNLFADVSTVLLARNTSF